MKLTLTAISILTALLLSSCRIKDEEPKDQSVQPPRQVQSPQQTTMDTNVHAVVAQEVIQANNYTYLRVKEKESVFWIAITKRKMEVGDAFSFTGGLKMTNFKSKDLQRTFETIYFVGQISGKESSPIGGKQSGESPHQTKPTTDKKEISIEPIEGGISIGELFSNRDSYANKIVLIKGQVTKFNRMIMKKNWVHLQDGTSGSGKFDLTVTTQDEVSVGDIVTFEGLIVLNKDFGSGYAYDVLMEEAKLQAE